jgi:hypothetical protein
MPFNHDYQKDMTADAKYLDQVGEHAAEGTTVKNSQTHETKEVTQHDDGTYVRDVGVMGMLPAQPLPIDFAIKKQVEFREMAAETDAQAATPTGSRTPGSGTGAAFKSQARMSNNYADDVSRLEDSQREYDIFAPLGNMAAQSYEKMKTVGETIGINEGFQLNRSETAALDPAGRTADGTRMLQPNNSVGAAGRKVTNARNALLSAGDKLAQIGEERVLKGLRAEIGKKQGEEKDIEEKIERVAHIVGYLETAASLIAGGAGLAAAPGAVEVEGSAHEAVVAVKEANEPSEHQETINKDIEKGGGITESAVKLGMGIVYANKLAEIKGQISALMAAVPQAEAEVVRQEIASAQKAFDAATGAYSEAVTDYQNAVEGRRDTLAAVGKKADLAVDKTGNDPIASQGMVWTTTAMETQSFMETAMSAGADVQKTVDAAEDLIVKHRLAPWGTLDDGATESNTPRKEGLGGPDVVAIKSMMHLVDWWMQGAEKTKKEVDDAVKNGASHLLTDAGYTGEY